MAGFGQHILRISTALLCLGALAACDPVETTRAAAPGVVGPGAKLLGPSTALKYFGDVCVDTAPDFDDAVDELAAPAFEQDPSSEIYYHQTLNMSFRLIPERGGITCSMVFKSNDATSAEDIGLAFAFRATRLGEIGVDPDSFAATSDGPDGTRMIFTPLPATNFYSAVLGDFN